MSQLAKTAGYASFSMVERRQVQSRLPLATYLAGALKCGNAARNEVFRYAEFMSDRGSELALF
jgi:hypothetical protein